VIVYWSVGFAFAFGETKDNNNSFIGIGAIFLIIFGDQLTLLKETTISFCIIFPTRFILIGSSRLEAFSLFDTLSFFFFFPHFSASLFLLVLLCCDSCDDCFRCCG
jgi:hypothetical protein